VRVTVVTARYRVKFQLGLLLLLLLCVRKREEDWEADLAECPPP
jgi:hypothetical protein